MTTPEERERNRAKQARFRARHAQRLAREAELRSSLAGPKGHHPPGYRVVELVYAGGELDGLPADVRVVRCGERVEVPMGMVEDRRWLPPCPLSQEAARRLRVFRLGQIIEWAGGQRPAWLTVTGRFS